MKRMILVWVMVLCLVPLCAWAEEETTPALYPIRENGLWGYMNRAEEVVIEPQWATVWPFDGDTALVSTLPVSRDSNGNGVIDRSGQYLIAPQDHVTIEDYPHAYRIRFYDTSQGYSVSYEGFYDKASGFYQPPIPEYAFVMLWGDDGSGPIAIENADGLTGYVDRTSGETVIPFCYTGQSEYAAFNEGYALAANLNWLDENGMWHEVLPDSEPIPDNDEIWGEGWRYYLIDTAGQAVRFPEDMEPYTGVREGVLVIHPDPSIQWEMQEDPEENTEAETSDSYIFDRFGIARPDGTVILEPQPLYYLWEPDSEGMLCYVDSSKFDCGHMNRSGEVIVSARYSIDAGGAMPYYAFVNGYAVIDDIGDNWPNTERWVILDTAGNEVFTRPAEDEDGSAFRICGDIVLENGLFWCEEANGYSLMRLTDHGAEKVSDMVFEASLGCGHYEFGEGIKFCEGLHPVNQDGLWGYIDEQAEWVIQPQYSRADNFSDGLALVEKDGKLKYIDHSGAVVWEER